MITFSNLLPASNQGTNQICRNTKKHEKMKDLTNIFLDLTSEYLEKDVRNTLQTIIDELNFESDNKLRI